MFWDKCGDKCGLVTTLNFAEVRKRPEDGPAIAAAEQPQRLVPLEPQPPAALARLLAPHAGTAVGWTLIVQPNKITRQL